MRTFSVHLPVRVLLVAALASAALLGTSSAAHASAMVFDYQFTNVFGPDPADEGSVDDCRGMPIETFGGTEVFNFHDVLTPVDAIHEHATLDATYRATFADGSYVLSTVASAWNYNFPLDIAGEVTKRVDTVSTATVYDADGNVIGTELLHEHTHVSRTGLFEPNDLTDTVHVRFDKAQLTCSV